MAIIGGSVTLGVGQGSSLTNGEFNDIVENITTSEIDSTNGNLKTLVLEDPILLDISSSSLFVTNSYIDIFSISESPTVQAIARLFEDIGITDTLSHIGTLNTSIVDIVNLNDLAAIAYVALLQDNITVSETDSTILTKLQIILEYLNLLDTSSTQLTASTALAVALTIVDSIDQPELIFENLTIDDSFILDFQMAQLIVENLQGTLTDSTTITFLEIITEEPTLDETVSLQQNIKNILTENIVFTTPLSGLSGTYSSWVINPENYAISNYSNFEFNSSDLFDTKYIFGSSTGLYEMGGTLDESTYIQSRIKTAVLDFGISSMKQVPEVLLGVNNSGKVILRVMVDDIHEVYYRLIPSTSGLATQQIKLGKGLYGRYWQFELITEDNSNFDLDTFEFLPIVYGRKLR